MDKSNKSMNKAYIISIIALILGVVSFLGVMFSNTGIEWTCNYAECTEYVDVTGEEWAEDNCFATDEGVFCVATLEDGRQFEVPFENIDINEISATKCVSYTCIEEVPYRNVNYEVEI